MTNRNQATYGVRGLTCNRCLVSALEAVRALPGIRRVEMSLIPSGESLLAVTPVDAATGSELRARLGSVGFELTMSHPAQPPPARRSPRVQHRGATARPPLSLP